MAARPRVSVIGSVNTDISVTVPRLPGPGETVLGSAAAVTGPGGKGANQAVAAARLGASVRINGCRGGDDFGERLAAGLAAEGVDISGLRASPGTASGLALITVDPAGENAIAVAPGANSLAGEETVAAALAVHCDVLVLSAEVPAGVLRAALAAAAAEQVPVVLNLAPVPPGALELVAAGPDWLVVNAPEAGAVLGRSVTGVAGARDAARSLTAAGARHVVVTLGSAGAVLSVGTAVTAIPGCAVASIDSVGAGDAFVGALAVALAAGTGPEQAVRLACAAGAAATTVRGAQPGLPGPERVRAVTGVAWPVPASGTGH